MPDVANWLSDTQDQVATAQLVLTEVERGLVAVEHVEQAARRIRPLLRTATVVVLACVVGTGVVVLVNRRRRAGQTVDAGHDPVSSETS